MRSVCALPSKPPAVGGDRVQGPLAVVAERGVADVVGEARGVDDVGVGPEVLGHAPPDLGDLERVRQPGARHAGDLGVLVGTDDLRLAGEAAQRRRVQHPSPVAGEGRAPVAARLGRLVEQARGAVREGAHPSPGSEKSDEPWVRW